MLPLDPAVALQQRHWLARFDRAAALGARHYIDAGLVCDPVLHHDPQGALRLLASVQGSAAEPYRIEIHIHSNGRGGFDYRPSCSCPAGAMCSHAAAVLIHASKQYAAAANTAAAVPPPEPEPWQRWLQTLPDAPAPASEPTPASMPDRQLAVLLDLDTHSAGLMVCAVWLEFDSQGRAGKPQPLRAPSNFAAGDWAQLPAHEHALLARLRMGLEHFGEEWPWHRLQGAHGERLLLDLLAAGLLYPRKVSTSKTAIGPLTLGAQQQFCGAWQLAADGTQRWVVQSTVERSGLIPLQRDWLYQPERGELTPVSAPVDWPNEELARLPAIEAEQAAAFAAVWRAHPRLAGLPAPQPLIVEHRTVAAVAHLRLSAQPLVDLKPEFGSHTHLPLFDLAFDYAGQRATLPVCAAQLRHVDRGRVRIVQRDVTAETAALTLLENSGCKRVDQQSELLGMLGDKAVLRQLAVMQGRQIGSLVQALQLSQDLREQGFVVVVDPDFPVRLIDGQSLPWFASFTPSDDDHAWFDAALGVEIDGEQMSLLPILQAALSDKRFSLTTPVNEPADAVLQIPLDDLRLLSLPCARVRQLIAPLAQWLEAHAGNVRLPQLAVGLLDDYAAHAELAIQLNVDSGLRALADRLRAGGVANSAALPDTIQASLRPYQRDGVAWLRFLADNALGGVLADDMGLGKTLQILSHLAQEKSTGRLGQPALVVAPTSVVGNWVEQAGRFVPSLRLCLLHGANRHENFDDLPNCDIAITSYALLSRDSAVLCAQPFALVIFDEAQALKNPDSQVAAAARELQSDRRLAVTGTPLENHLGEVWALFDLVLPGLLGTRQRFARHVRTPIEKHADEDAQASLNRRIAPFVLRRSKQQVASDLPPKTEIVYHVDLEGGQRALYENLRLAMHDRVKEAIKARGLAQSSIVLLDALIKLRQACCDPRLVKLDAASVVTESAKLDALLPMLEQLQDEGRRILLFSQFTGMLDLIESALDASGIEHLRLDGSTIDRDTPIRRFQAGEVPLFLISLKAGGVGLNLTAADTVIHYDPWWNPAVERQATDRAHRIGQDKPVFVYKFIARGTVEEKILHLQTRKAELAEALLDGGSREKLDFSEDDIDALFDAL